MTQLRTVVLVGHCGPDVHMLRTAVARVVPGAAVVAVKSSAALMDHASQQHVLLVNRVLDGDFEYADGIELIAALAKHAQRPELMLLSNYSESQDAAVAAGARRGFGKTQLYIPSTADALRAAITFG